MAKVIKLQNGSTQLLPVTDSAYVQYRTLTNGTTSVKDAIDQLVTQTHHEAGSDDQTLSYTSGTGLQLTHTNNNGTSDTITINGTTEIPITGATNSITIGHKTHSISAVTPFNKNITGDSQKVIASISVNSYGHVTGYTAVNVSSTDTNYYDTITDKGFTGYEVATITAHDTGSSSSLHVPQATSNYLGVVKLGYTEANKGYALKLDSNGKGYVNVPWTDTVPDYSNTYAAKSHTHGNIQNDGTLSTASRVVVTDGSKKIGVSSVTTTELGYLSGTTSNIQTQIDTINTTMSSGMHMRGTTTTVPGASTAYVVGDSYVYSPSSATATITIPAAQSQSGAAEVVGKGDMITYLSSGKWAVIQNNIGDYVSHIKTTDDDKWIQATPTSNTSGDVTIDITHIGPYNATEYTKSATSGTAATLTTSSEIQVLDGVKLTYDAKGHVSNIAVTSKALKISYTNTDGAIHKWSSTSGKTNDTGTTAVVNPYLNVHPTAVATGASAVQLKGDTYLGIKGTPSTGLGQFTSYYSKNVLANSATGTANATSATTNTTTFLNHIETDGTTTKFTSSNKITGSGLTTVSANAGTLTISTPAPSTGQVVTDVTYTGTTNYVEGSTVADLDSTWLESLGLNTTTATAYMVNTITKTTNNTYYHS